MADCILPLPTKRGISMSEYEGKYANESVDCHVPFKNYVDTSILNPNRIKDSGDRSEFATGAVRDLQTGKGRMDLLPVRALMAVAEIMEEGAKKYDARNWEKGIPLSRFMDSGLRHAFKWLRGDRDEPHLARACWNFLCLLDTQKRISEGLLSHELNDIPNNPLGCGIPDRLLSDGTVGDSGNAANWSE